MRSLAREARASIRHPNVTPPWLLFFLRLVRASRGDYAMAWRQLPAHLPRGVCCPSLVECAAVLAAHHLA